MEQKLLFIIKDLDFLEVVALGNMVGAEQQEDFMEYIVSIISKFSEKPRKEKRELLSMLKDIIKDKKKAKNRGEKNGKNLQ